MQKFLTQEDTILVEAKLKSFEKNTGCELLLVMAQSSDDYPGAPWRFGVIFGFLVTLTFAQFLEFEHGYWWPLFTFLVTLVGVYIGHFTWAKRLALSDLEIDRETFEKSLEYFHTLGTSKVTHKITAMIMVSVLERKIMVLVDEKLKSEISQAELDELITIMKTHFKAGNMGLGFVQSIESLEAKILKDFGGKVSDVNPSELKDQIVFI